MSEYKLSYEYRFKTALRLLTDGSRLLPDKDIDHEIKHGCYYGGSDELTDWIRENVDDHIAWCETGGIIEAAHVIAGNPVGGLDNINYERLQDIRDEYAFQRRLEEEHKKVDFGELLKGLTEEQLLGELKRRVK